MLGSPDLLRRSPVIADDFPPANAAWIGVHMSVTFRRVGLVAGVVVVGTILLCTSTLTPARLTARERKVNLRLSLSVSERPGVPLLAEGVWAAAGPFGSSEASRAVDAAFPGLDSTSTTAPEGQTRRMVVTVMAVIPFQTNIHYTPTLTLGTIQILTPGIPGTQARTYRITYRGGAEVSRKLLWHGVATPSRAQVENYGTYPVPLPATQRTQFGEATWYPNCPTRGLYAAHTSLPFGTRVTVTNLDNSASITVVIDDRGPYGPGRILDLCPEAFAQLAPLGQGVAFVKITW